MGKKKIALELTEGEVCALLLVAQAADAASHYIGFDKDEGMELYAGSHEDLNFYMHVEGYEALRDAEKSLQLALRKAHEADWSEFYRKEREEQPDEKGKDGNAENDAGHGGAGYIVTGQGEIEPV